MVCTETNPGAAEKFRFRYKYLLVEVGTKLLRQLFDYSIKERSAKYCTPQTTEARTLQYLISIGEITSYQAQYLPPVVVEPDSSNFDMSLLICLLRNVCGLKHPHYKVWKDPPHDDASVEADIARLSICRNRLLCYGTIVFISEECVTDKWNELSQIMERLNTSGKIPNMYSLINDAEKMDIDEMIEQRHDKVIKAWTEMDNIFHRDIQTFEHGFGHTKLVYVRKIYQLRWKQLKLVTTILQKLFDYRVGNDLKKYLTSNEAEETKLDWLMVTNRITKRQVKLLSECTRTTSSYEHMSEQTLIPPSDQTPSASLKSPKLDISLLIVLLRYICGLRAPNDLIWKEPLSMDMSMEADIIRLGQCRNSIMKLKHLDDENVKELSRILCEIKKRRLGIQDDPSPSTGDAPFDDYFDDLYMNMLEEWYDNDQRDIKFQHEYPETDLFQDSDDSAWAEDEENVSLLLSGGKLPNAKQLKKSCETFGSSSRTIRKICAYICNTLQMTSHHVKRCWPAYVYDKHTDNDTNLVTFVAVKDIEITLNIDQIFEKNIRVYELFHGTNSGETAMMIKQDIKNQDNFHVEMNKIETYVCNHSLSLMQKHSNITLIAGSTVKSIRYMFENKKVIKHPCVVIYVHKKGYIPLGEKPFPSKLDDEFDTDVRECVVDLFRNNKAYEHNDNLLMGTSITNRWSTGTLGGFVEHSLYGLCGLTCAHVLCADHLNGTASVKHWSQSDPKIEVFQPALAMGTSIGNVVCALLRQDNRVGIDIALVSIERRPPNSGQFAIDTSEDLNVNEYTSGSCLHKSCIQSGASIFKFGSITGRTVAKVVRKSGCFRDNTCILNNQLLVQSEPQDTRFADKGDSGALSFVEDDSGLHAIGVVVGGDLQSGLCVLTPLTDILDALNENGTVQVTMKDFIVPDEPMQE